MRYTNMDEAAREAFGIQRLHDLQRTVIANILRGERQIVLLPTGYGKSLCFLVPALMLNGATLVIYPLLALMADQQRRMKAAGICAVTLKGGQTKQQRAAALDALKSGRAQVALANPEVLQSKALVAALAQCNIAHIAVDEAHCVSEWGDSFRAAYLGIGGVIRQLGVQRVTAFTATASPAVLSRIQALLFADGGAADAAPQARIVKGSFDRANLRYRVQYAEAKQQALIPLVLSLPKPLLVFCGTRRSAEDTARLLAAFFCDRARLSHATPTSVRFYHAGLTKSEKTSIEKWFFSSDDGVLCATCAYGMGVDKPNIRTCIHLDAPTKIEFFVQEAGRAGRDGNEALSVLLWSHSDRRRFPQLAGYAESRTCRRQYLLDYLHGAKDAECSACSGCDVCEAAARKAPQGEQRKDTPSATAGSVALPYTAYDAEFVLRWVRRNRRRYTQSEALPLLLDALNEADRPALGMNVWDINAVRTVLTQLLDANRIRMVGMGTKAQARLSLTHKCAKKHAAQERRKAPILRRRHRRLLRRLRRHFRQLAQVLERLQPTS